MNENAHGDGESEIDDDSDNGGDCDVVDDIYIIVECVSVCCKVERL